MPTPSKAPTLAQLELLRAIWDLTTELGYPPCFRELAERMGVPSKSKQAIADWVIIACREGWAVRENMVQRSLRLTRLGRTIIGKPDGCPYCQSAHP